MFIIFLTKNKFAYFLKENMFVEYFIMFAVTLFFSNLIFEIVDRIFVSLFNLFAREESTQISSETLKSVSSNTF